MRRLNIRIERFPLASAFVISRGSRTEAAVVVVTLVEGHASGRGECVPYARYGESVDSVIAQIEALRPRLEAGLDRAGLQNALKPGAARNAIDCALWDLDAKKANVPVFLLAGIDRISPATTAYTISLGTPDAMAAAARVAAHRPVLKIKLGGAGDAARLAAIRHAAPDSTLIVDANEAWTPDLYAENIAACIEADVALIEQPFPAGKDEALASLPRPIPICADESVHDRHGLPELRRLYDAINIKLDKTGGLTEALLLAKEARALGFQIFVGCMVGTSLGMAPALLLTPGAQFVDLDGPLLLAKDRDDGLIYEGSLVYPPKPALWG
jgi:L-alanine-DL-glutamate epimerase-like enolase superfamily enzyme